MRWRLYLSNRPYVPGVHSLILASVGIHCLHNTENASRLMMKLCIISFQEVEEIEGD